MSAELPLGESKPHRLPARFARILFYLASGGRFARLRLRSVHRRQALLRSTAHCRVGSELAHFARLGNVTGFSRYAERMGSALSVTRRYKYALSSSDIAVCIGSASRSSCRFPSNQHNELRRGQPVGALAASFWRRERKAEPTTMRSILLSVRQGPVLVSKLTNVSVTTFASFVRVIHPLALPPRRSPACAALARRSERVPGCPC